MPHHPATARPTERVEEYLKVIGVLAEQSELLSGARTIKVCKFGKARDHGTFDEVERVLGKFQQSD